MREGSYRVGNVSFFSEENGRTVRFPFSSLSLGGNERFGSTRPLDEAIATDVPVYLVRAFDAVFPAINARAFPAANVLPPGSAIL